MVRSVPSERSWKRLIFRWTAPTGVVAMVLFSALAIFVEFLAVYLFRWYGLVDTQSFQLPLTILPVTISPLFHLMPVGVIIVLVSSWTYLTKHIAKVPRRRIPVKKSPARKPVKQMGRKRFKSIRSLSKKISWEIRKVTRALRHFYDRIKASLPRIRGVSPLAQRPIFARAAIKSTMTIVLIFLASFLVLHLMGSPRLIHNLVVGFYRGNPSFHGFVIGTIEAAGSIGRILSPIGWLASALNNALISAAPGFRSALEGVTLSLTGSLVALDPMWRYVICQNIAAWVSAIVALAYAQFTTHLYRRHRG